ncbi:AraC family transcriptional regulator [Nostoc sp. MG11]|uniref:AraC family transcriptional regulator n=1 Tax=Nostoc sp. MG11 TaxID=2721166 RepID=UPI001D011E7D|nr:AraC family transcriptional regulator [Nostoc sp. MG11]
MNAAKTSEKSDIDLMNDPQAKREVDRAQANRDELKERIAQAIRHDGTIEPLKGLHFNRSSSPSECIHSVSIPAFCAIAQGSKEVLLGSDRYQCDPMHYLLSTVKLPIVSQILEASKMSPLQFQKQLRLQEARRLMLGKTLTLPVLPTVWGTTMPRTSTGSTSGSLVHHRCAMWKGCEKLLGRLLVQYDLLKMP